ncbi:transglycosylase SLT domain-containing protein [Methylophaga sp. OBS1]|uniref:transglycosylase SLT domain-containing protein n=1 Tax=Methylophaga sp. OBS1 TaxID=2991933 RepID=UPI002250F6D0|nr:transglycosylase SLT domain-containing protein [Methylophaga sp. OBS1]MCX4192653.1 transglycosylase SLT domain-containing protein [Methylophaga sp. OBS1]
MRWTKTLWFYLAFLALSPIAMADSQAQLEKQRQTFQFALKALQTNQVSLFRQFHEQLDGYPLQGYLQYLYLRHRLEQVSIEEIETFLAQEKDSFYAERLRAFWLDRLAKQQRWQRYLQFYQAPQSAERECYRLQALLATGQTEKAFELTPAMWLVPHSQHKACDPVFSRWQQAGLLSEDLRHQRFMLALRDNQFSIANYLARTGPQANRELAWVARWKTIHNNPIELLRQLPATAPADNTVSLARDEALSREIIVHGLTRLARRSPEKAFEQWQQLRDHYQFSQQDQIEVRRAIGTWAALNRDDRALIYFGNIPGGEWQARAAIWQQDWRAAIKAIKQMNIDEQASTRWQYWLGRSQAGLGQKDAASETFAAIVGQRDYYSFLASDELAKPYAMNHRPIAVSAAILQDFRQQPSVQRLHEFYLQDMMLEARREAYYQSQRRSDAELQMLATITHEWGWHNQTIALLGKAQYWDALDLRFPVIFDKAINQAGQNTGLDPSWLLAIARQESAFNPTARSHAGALGLMQLMPDTGRLISKLINRPLKQLEELYHPERNIELGSAYLKRMLDENQRNPVLATAAYNAGPHRVSRWLPSERLDATIWAENIPFNETRHYVQTVMSYAAIFDNQRNQAIKPLSERMPAIKPKTP